MDGRKEINEVWTDNATRSKDCYERQIAELREKLAASDQMAVSAGTWVATLLAAAKDTCEAIEEYDHDRPEVSVARMNLMKSRAALANIVAGVEGETAFTSGDPQKWAEWNAAMLDFGD